MGGSFLSGPEKPPSPCLGPQTLSVTAQEFLRDRRQLSCDPQVLAFEHSGLQGLSAALWELADVHAAQHRPSGTHTHVHGGLGSVPGSGHTSHDHPFLALPLLVLGSREVTREGRELPGLCP